MEANLTLSVALLAAGCASALIFLHALADVLLRRRLAGLTQDLPD